MNLRKIVIVVAAANIAYFGIEFTVALAIGSVSLFADSIDFLEDASVNLLIAVGLGWSATGRARLGARWASTCRDERRCSARGLGSCPRRTTGCRAGPNFGPLGFKVTMRSVLQTLERLAERLAAGHA